MSTNAILKSIESYLEFLEPLKTMDIQLAETPISAGKWSIKQIISHIYRWDVYLAETVFPSALMERKVTFPSHDEYNKGSEQYSNIISFEELLNQSVHIRRRMITELEQQQFFLVAPITVNGYSHCPDTNSQYTLEYLMSEFVEHDRHHSKQISDFLSKRLS